MTTTPPPLPPYHSPSEFGPCDHVVSLKDAIAYAEACRADERRKARAELIAEITAPGPVAFKWRTAARYKTGTPGPWHLSLQPFNPVPIEVDEICCYAIPTPKEGHA